MSNELVEVPFHGDVIEAMKDEKGDVWVPIKRPCESLGIAPNSQIEKLKAKPWAVNMMIISTGPDGKSYQMFALRLDCLPMWLATIDTNRVDEGIRPKLELYQKDAARVLAEHFLGPQPSASATPKRGKIGKGAQGGRGGTKGMMSVYPPKDLGPILGGYRSVPLGRAISRDAERIMVAAIKLQTLFGPEEWELMYQVLGSREWPADLLNPSDLLAHVLDRAHLLAQPNANTQRGAKSIQEIAKKARACNYDEASAIIIALTYRFENPKLVYADQAWWTIAYRVAQERQLQETA